MAAPNSTTTQGSIDNPDTIIIPVSALANLANSQVLKIALPYAFAVTAAGFRVGDKAVTTGAKAATATVQISGTAVTGGVISLTSANCTPSGALVASTAITALNSTFTPGSTLEVAISGVTAFAEGDGWFEFTVLPTSAG